MPSTLRPSIVQPVIAVLLQFFTCAYLAFGIFTVPIETAAPSLITKWSASLAITNLVYSLVMVITGLLLAPGSSLATSSHDALAQRHTHLIRRSGPPVAALYLALLLVSRAVATANEHLLHAAGVALGVPLGVFYLFAVHVLVAWMPAHPGLAMSLVSLSIAVAQGAASVLLQLLLERLGLHGCFLATAVLLALATGSLATLLRLPTAAEARALSARADCATLPVSGGTASLPWHVLACSGMAYLYIAVVLLGRVSFCMIQYYFKLMHVLQVPSALAARLFELLSTVQVVYAFGVNRQIERLYVVTRFAGRNCLVLAFGVQGALFLATILTSVSEARYPLAVAAVTLNALVVDTQTACGILVAREVFGLENVGAVYGIAGGIAIGIGEALSTGLMAAVEQWSVAPTSPSTFIPFYVAATCACAVGIPCALSLRQHQVSFKHVEEENLEQALS